MVYDTDTDGVVIVTDNNIQIRISLQSDDTRILAHKGSRIRRKDAVASLSKPSLVKIRIDNAEDFVDVICSDNDSVKKGDRIMIIV